MDLVCRSVFDGEKYCRRDLWKYLSEVLTLTDCANPPAHVLITVDLFHVCNLELNALLIHGFLL